MTARNPALTLRVSKAGRDYLAQLVTESGHSESLVIRAMFSVATKHRPELLRKLTQLAAQEPGMETEQ